jgi:NADH-quinone oxidoreductase subunit C
LSDDNTTATADGDVDAPAALPGDGLREGIIDALRAAIGDAVIETHISPNDDLWIRVRTDAWRATGDALKAAGFTYFCFLSAIDWMPSPYGTGEEDPEDGPVEIDPTIVQGVTGGGTRLQVFARVTDLDRHVGVTIKADVPEGDEAPVMDSWSSLYAGANWHERECHEMFGIGFNGHPDLRNMYLPGDFEGYPLRKDFPLLARMVKPWPGIVDVEPMPAQDDEGDES